MNDFSPDPNVWSIPRERQVEFMRWRQEFMDESRERGSTPELKLKADLEDLERVLGRALPMLFVNDSKAQTVSFTRGSAQYLWAIIILEEMCANVPACSWNDLQHRDRFNSAFTGFRELLTLIAATSNHRSNCLVAMQLLYLCTALMLSSFDDEAAFRRIRSSPHNLSIAVNNGLILVDGRIAYDTSANVVLARVRTLLDRPPQRNSSLLASLWCRLTGH